MINATSEEPASECERMEDGVWVIKKASRSLSELLASAEGGEQLLHAGSTTFRVSVVKGGARSSARGLLSKGGPLD